MSLFEPYSFTRDPREAGTSLPGPVGTPAPARPGRAGTLFSLVGWLGLATYSFGMPTAVWAWLS